MKYSLALLVALSAIGCSSDSEPGTPVVLGAVIDQTGNNSELSWLQAVELALGQFNDALAAEGQTGFHFKLSPQNSENDVVGGADSRAINRIRDTVRDGARAATIDTTQIAEEANKPGVTDELQIPMQCSSCTGGSFLSATASVPTDADLQASRRNSQFWMSRTIMSTGLQAQVVAQLIRASPNGGDVNGDGIIKVQTYGSDEAFGQATTTAVATELLKLVPRDQQSRVVFERKLHNNAQDPRDIDFSTDIDGMLDAQNVDLTPTNGNYPNNPHFNTNPPPTGQTALPPPEPDLLPAQPDYIAVATFGRNDVQFITNIKGRNLPGLGSSIRVVHFQTFRFSSNLLVLGELAEGEIGVSHVVKDGPTGDQFATDFQAKFGLVPVYRDAIYYDNAMTMLLGMFTAMQDAAAPDQITGVQVRNAMPCSSVNAARAYAPTCTPVPPATTCVARPETSCPAGADITPVGPGIDNIRIAIRTIQARQPIEYTGASGPVDYDALGNIKNRVALFTVRGGRYEDIATFDCVNSNTCPCISGECPGQ
ncbi:MAG: ABC transporter substrate-binding protein [Myxococcota bacterium]